MPMSHEEFLNLRSAAAYVLETIDELQDELVDRAPADEEPERTAPRDERALDIHQVSELYGVSESFLRKHTEIPHMRLGKNKRAPVRWRVSDLNRFFSEYTA